MLRSAFVILCAQLLTSGIAMPARSLADDKKADRIAVGTKAGQEWFANGLKMKFCWCPAGKFLMGSPTDEPDRSADENQIQVTLTKGFWLGKYEVTQGEWQRVMETTLAEQRDKTNKASKLSGEADRCPMYFVSHNEAVEFCQKMTKQDHASGQLLAEWEYQLPTEARWEYACRAGTTTATAFGPTLNSKQANFTEMPFDPTKAPEKSLPVGSFSPNAWGLHDMHGNVCEWCRDWYVEQLTGGLDPDITLETTGRVIRGGAWGNSGPNCRSANREQINPARRGWGGGFRVAAVQLSK